MTVLLRTLSCGSALRSGFVAARQGLPKIYRFQDGLLNVAMFLRQQENASISLSSNTSTTTGADFGRK